MLVLEYKAITSQQQAAAIDEAIRTGQFIQNKCLRAWMDRVHGSKHDLNKYCKQLAAEFTFAATDAAWYEFRRWIEYYGEVYGKTTIVVPPQFTSQECSSCGAIVKKSLSTRTHVCECGCRLDRDHNAAINILILALSTVGHTGTSICEMVNASGVQTAFRSDLRGYLGKSER